MNNIDSDNDVVLCTSNVFFALFLSDNNADTVLRTFTVDLTATASLMVWVRSCMPPPPIPLRPCPIVSTSRCAPVSLGPVPNPNPNCLQWDGGTTGWGHNGAERDGDGSTMGRGHNKTGTQ